MGEEKSVYMVLVEKLENDRHCLEELVVDGE
jgi:hypothetical protein